MRSVISRDGTAIVYDRYGSGPVLIIVNGALSHRHLGGDNKLADILAAGFTVILYDRRGRGESRDSGTYDVQKEIEDIEALIDETGGDAYLYGSSSGAALSLLAANKLGAEKVRMLALYEPPFNSGNDDDLQKYSQEKGKINQLISMGNMEEAVSTFLQNRGMPKNVLENMKRSPEWKEYEQVGHTLHYDFEVLGDGTIPVAVTTTISVPVLVIDGEKSFDFIHASADALSNAIAGARRQTLPDQAHDASPLAVAPVLIKFFKKEYSSSADSTQETPDEILSIYK